MLGNRKINTIECLFANSSRNVWEYQHKWKCINAGRMRLMLIQLQLLPFTQHTFFLPCSAAAILQTAKARRDVRRLSLAFSAFTGNVPLDFCIYACVVVMIDSLKLWSKNPSFFSKIYLDGWPWSALIFKRFFAPFHLPYSGISQKNRSYRNCEHEKMAWSSGFPVLVQLSHTRGRVVIPKEIRRTMRIREGDPLEIFFIFEGEVSFKKYSPIKLLLISKENLRFLIFNPPMSNISFLTYSQTPWQQEVAYCPDNILPPLYFAYGFYFFL